MTEQIAAPRLITRRCRYRDVYDLDDNELEENNVQWTGRLPSDNDVHDQHHTDCPSDIYGMPKALSIAVFVECKYPRRHRYLSIDQMEDSADSPFTDLQSASSRQGLPLEPFVYCIVAADAQTEGRVRPSATPTEPQGDTRAVDVKVFAAADLAAPAIRANDELADSLSAAPGATARTPGGACSPCNTCSLDEETDARFSGRLNRYHQP